MLGQAQNWNAVPFDGECPSGTNVIALLLANDLSCNWPSEAALVGQCCCCVILAIFCDGTRRQQGTKPVHGAKPVSREHASKASNEDSPAGRRHGGGGLIIAQHADRAAGGGRLFHGKSRWYDHRNGGARMATAFDVHPIDLNIGVSPIS
jgi:hypothetical protein